MGHEGEILLTTLLHLPCTLRGIGFQGRTDCMVENPIKNVKRFPLERQSIVVSKIVDTAAKNIVFRDHLFDIKLVLQALEPMRRRTALAERLGDRLVRLCAECHS